MSEEEFNIWGEMDVDTISDDPWAIENNWYEFKITKSFIEKTRVEGEEAWFWKLTYMIDMPGTAFHSKTVTERFEVFPYISSREVLTSDQRQNQERMKQRMVHGFGIPEKELSHYGRNVSELVGRVFWGRVKNNPGRAGTEAEGKMFPNLNQAQPTPPSNRFASSEASMGLGSENW